MGTRSITRVIDVDGNRVINQYCQWDGYPTGCGVEVMKFVKEYCGKNLSDFAQKLEESSLYSLNYGSALFTGAPYKEEIIKKVDTALWKNGSGRKICENLLNLVSQGHITLDEASFYITAVRDTGPTVLRWLMEPSVKELIFYTTNYLTNITEELDWQIEGLFTIDLNRKMVEINYHGRRTFYPFESVVEMSDDKIMEEMESFEKGDEDEL